MLEPQQIKTTVMTMGKPDREYIGLSKPQAKARKFFGMKKLISWDPREFN